MELSKLQSILSKVEIVNPNRVGLRVLSTIIRKHKIVEDMKRLFATIIIMLHVVAALAEPVEIDGLKYVLNADDKTASVSSGNSYSGILVIPEKVTYKEVEYTVTDIGANAFYWTDLLSVTIPESVKNIGYYAFSYCSSLASAKIGDGVETIDNGAFYGCGLVSVTMGNNIRNISSSAFGNCSKLTQVYISDLAAWCSIDFYDVYSNPLYYAHHLFLNKKEVKDLVIPEGITEIKQYAFAGGNNITSLTTGNEVTTINEGAFYQCSSLAEVIFGSAINSIGSQAFAECGQLQSAILPDGVTKIGSYAFSECSKLDEVKLAAELKIIGEGSFYNCSSLNNIIVPAKVEFIYANALNTSSDNPPTIVLTPEYPPVSYSSTLPEGATIIVQDESLELYQNMSPWNSFQMLTFSGSGPEKCATPKVIYKNGVLSFSSDTPDVDFHYVITSADGQKSVGNNLNISGNCTVSVYASKKGYEDSETITSEINIIGKQGDVNRDGQVNVADHVTLTEIIMGQANAGHNE